MAELSSLFASGTRTYYEPKEPCDGRKLRAQSIARFINSCSSWSSRLESSLSTFLPLSVFIFLRVLRSVDDPSKALEFFSWTHKQPGFPHQQHSYFLMLEILGQSRNLNRARNFLFSIEKRSNRAVKLEDKFFNSLIRSYGLAGLFRESLKLFSVMKSMAIPPSSVTFNSLLQVLGKHGRFDMAEKLFDEMLKTYGVTPDAYTFNILIRGLCKTYKVERAFQIFRQMSQHGCEPNIVTYNTIIDGLCREGKVKIAHNVVRGMIKKTNAASNLAPNAVTFTSLLRGYCMKGEIDAALSVLKEMINQGVKPNEITYNTLLKGVCDSKGTKMMETVEGAIKGAGPFTPDTCSFNILLDAHCNVGDMDEAFRTFEKMKELRIFADCATYGILISKLCQNGDFNRAEQLFDDMLDKRILLRDDGISTPYSRAYRLMFEFLCDNGKTSKAETVFRHLMKKGTLDSTCFKILVLGHCKEGTFKAGYELLVLMLRRSFVPDLETYESLLTGLLNDGEALLACKTLEKMLRSSFLPNTSTFHRVLDVLLERGCIHESASFIELMLQKNVIQNLNLSTSTVRLLFSHGLHDKAFHVVHILYDNGYLISMEEMITFLIETKMILNAQKLLLFCLETRQNVNNEHCDTVITRLCQIERHSEAFKLFYELVENNFQPQLSCPDHLQSALVAVGRLEEAQFVSTRIQKVADE